MDDPNITMEEYIRLEEEKARRRGKVFNWKTAKYGKIWYDEDVHDLRSVETEFPAIVYNDAFISEVTLSCEPTVSRLNDKIDLRISFVESDDEDYTPTVSYETSLSECDEEEQNVLYFNDLFSFNVIYPDDSKSDEDNNDDKIDIEHSSRDLSVKPLPDVINTDDGPREEISTNIGGEFTNMEILKCWSLETSRWLFNMNYCSINLHEEYTEQNIRGISHSNSF
ncbi:hypothetical protein Tco_1224451 [Tanacetum coccineum]